MLVSCSQYEDAYNAEPYLSAPSLRIVGVNFAEFYQYPNHYDRWSYGGDHNSYYTWIIVSERPDMSNAVKCETYRATSYDFITGHSSEITVSRIAGLKPNTKYYARHVAISDCYDDDEVYMVGSEVMEFKTAAYQPTPYSIKLSNLPTGGYYGVFTTDANGKNSYERLQSGYTLYPSTQITDSSSIYLTVPYISGATDPMSVPLAGGTDLYYAHGKVVPSSPSLYLTPHRYTAHVNVNITFKAAKEDADNAVLEQVAITNVSGKTPICLDGTLNLSDGVFTPSANSRTQYVNSTSTSIYSGKTVSRSFYGVIPVTFGEDAVKVVATLSGDVKAKVLSATISSSTWSEGSDVTLNFNAEYTASGMELTLTGVDVKPWSDGGTGEIDIIK